MNNKYFQSDFSGLKTEIMKNLRFTGHRIQVSKSHFQNGSQALRSLYSKDWLKGIFPMYIKLLLRNLNFLITKVDFVTSAVLATLL
jgi:hypothetical protein